MVEARDKTVSRLFEKAARAYPTAAAITAADPARDSERERGWLTLTYSELNAEANRLARVLRRHGVTRGIPVGLHLDRSPDFVLCVLAVLKAGGIYLPLGPDQPPSRLATLIRTSGLTLLLTAEEPPDLHESHGVECLPLPQLRAAMTRESGEDPGSEFADAHPGPEDPAYIMFTSGSTGEPKGVVVPHRAIVRLVVGQDYLPWGPDQRFLLLAPTAFDASTLELWGALLHGGCCVIHPERVPTVEGLEQVLRDQAVTTLWLTAGLFHHIIDQRPEILRPVRHLLAGGDVLSVPHVMRALAVLPSTDLINGYGPTEATTFTTTYAIPREGPMCGGASIPIGRPLKGTRCHVLDPEGRPVAPGEPGELFIGGAGVALGYWRRPDLTERFFVPDPFTGEAGARLYRSGDRVRWLPDGNLEFLGRLDEQVKIRGHRVEPAEIEAALASHAGVRESAVVARQGVDGGKELVAIVVPGSETVPSVAELRRHLRSRLSEAMVPVRWETLPRLPLNANGKVDRAALVTRGGPSLPTGRVYVPPRDDLERQLATLWARGLNVERVGIDDDFFELGGDSLRALRIAGQIRSMLTIDLSWTAVLVHRTVAALASAIRDSGSPVVSREGVVPSSSSPSSVPVSSGQAQMCFLHETAGDPATYNVAFAYRLIGKLDVARLDAAWRSVVARHGILRARFVSVDGLLHQEITDIDVGLEVVEGEGNLEEFLRRTARHAFDLARAPLWRMVICRFAEHETILVCNFHHALVDEWSLRLLFEEWAALSEVVPGGSIEQATRPGLAYTDYAAWQDLEQASARGARDREFWRQTLAEAPDELDLPYDRARPPVLSAAGGRVVGFCSAETRGAVEAIARDAGCSGFVAGFALFHLLLARLGAGPDLVIGTPVSGRDRLEFQEIIGPLINSVPVRVRMDPRRGFREMLGTVQQAVLEAFHHATLSTAEIARVTGRGQRTGGIPLFRVMFVLLNEPWPEPHFPGVTTRAMPLHTGTAKAELILSITSDPGGGWRVELEYATDLVDRETAERFLKYWQALVAGVIATPDLPVGRIPILDEAEAAQLRAWGAGRVTPAIEDRLQGYFEAQAMRTPEAIAVSCGDDRLTYAALNAIANPWARFLREQGVRPEDRVAVIYPRSTFLPALLLAVLKAGGAYMLLDGDLPPERVEDLLADAEPVLVLAGSRDSSGASGTSSCPEWRLPSRTRRVEVDSVDVSRFDTANLEPVNGPDDIAYVIYTSGSTGRPKGILIPHHAITHYLAWRCRRYPLGADEVILQKTAFGFDASIPEFWWPLSQGARLAMVEGDARDPHNLVENVQRQGVTQLQVVPTLLRALLEVPEFGACRSLRCVTTGGEVLTAEIIRDFHARLPGVALVNHYGPAEVTIDATAWECPDDWNDTALLGRPVDNLRAYVVDEDLQWVPAGVTGELCLAGPQVARGYLAREALTSERFVPDPAHPGSGSRMYRTGDRVRWRRDGNLVFVGRADHQLKIRGQRVEPGEIEAALLTHPGVREAVVVGRREANGDKELVAILVPAKDGVPTVADLRDHLRRKIPEGLIPTRWEVLAQLPRTNSGKVDRNRLERESGTALGGSGTSGKPRAGTEVALLRLWREALGAERATIHDDFFELGGHSLLAMRLVMSVRRELGAAITLADLFARPTVSQLAQHILTQDPALRRRTSSALRGTGPGAPLFHVPGFHGFEFLPRDFAEAIGTQRRYFDALQYAGLDGTTPPCTTVPDIAAALGGQIAEIWPEGPLCLSGYSGGGVVAMELARQLVMAERPVEVVLLYDSWADSGVRRRTWFEIGRVVLRRVLRTERGKRRTLLTELLTNWAREERARRKRPQPAVAAAEAAANRTIGPRERVATASYHALSAHRSQPYRGRVVLFKARDQSREEWVRNEPDPEHGWGRLVTGGLQVLEVPGGHLTLFREPSLTAVIQRTLEALESVP